MQDKNEIIKNFAGIALSTGLAIATQGSSNLILGTLSGMAGGIATNFIANVEFNKIKKLLKETDPSDLNHDLQKIIIQALEWAILNIQILYKKEALNKLQIEELNEFSKSLIEEVKILNTQLSKKGESFYKTIEKPKNEQVVFKTFDLKVDTFPVIYNDKPYNKFFKKHFTSNLQLCFGELLKNEKNRPALIAYQREIYQNLDTNIDRVISQNEKILKTLTQQEDKEPTIKENEKWVVVKDKISNKSLNAVTPEFENLLHSRLSNIKQDTELLIDTTSDIKNEIERVKGITVGLGKELKKNWIAKNKVLILSLFAIAALAITGLTYKLNTTPFQMNIGLDIDKNIKVHSEYPKLSKEARLRFYFPQENIEKEVTFNNEIILSEISNDLKNSKIKIELIDDYWKLSNNSIIINDTIIQLSRQPNDRLANISGKVISRNLQELIHNAIIKVDGLETSTNKNGEFSLNIPIELRKPDYIIRAEKEGYLSKEKYGVPNDHIEILISKKN